MNEKPSLYDTSFFFPSLGKRIDLKSIFKLDASFATVRQKLIP